jgi:hypothetical protein
MCETVYGMQGKVSSWFYIHLALLWIKMAENGNQQLSVTVSYIEMHHEMVNGIWRSPFMALYNLGHIINQYGSKLEMFNMP